MRVDDDPDWHAYIESVAAMQGPRLTHIVLTAEGRLFGDEADLAVVVVGAEGGFLVDTGNLHLYVAPGGDSLGGQMTLNSGEQTAVALVRRP